MIDWASSTILVTGGAGSFGRRFVETLLAEYQPKKLIIYSRDEWKQHEMRREGLTDPALRYFIGDLLGSLRSVGRRRNLQNLGFYR